MGSSRRPDDKLKCKYCYLANGKKHRFLINKLPMGPHFNGQLNTSVLHLMSLSTPHHLSLHFPFVPPCIKVKLMLHTQLTSFTFILTKPCHRTFLKKRQIWIIHNKNYCNMCQITLMFISWR